MKTNFLIIFILFIIVIISIGGTIIYGYEEYCPRIKGCEIINGECPSCIKIGVKPITDFDLKKLENNFKKSYPKVFKQNNFKLKENNILPGGWDTYSYPTWKVIRVLF